MDQGIRKKPGAHEEEPVSLGELVHERVRCTIETAVEEELAAALGARTSAPMSAAAVGMGRKHGP